MEVVTIAESTYTVRSIAFGKTAKVWCPYHLKHIDINGSKGCLNAPSGGGCQFLSTVKIGQVICMWTKAHGQAK